MTDRYPGYDVLSKRRTPSWNEPTRRAIDRRLAVPREPRFFSAAEWRTMEALCGRILPQPPDRPPVPLAALVDQKLLHDATDGFRVDPLPHDRDAWRRGLAALDAEALDAHGARFHEVAPDLQDGLLRRMQTGDLRHPAWGGMPSRLFFEKRVLVDIPSAYYAHPTAWNEIGFGGPASPRGYVRMALDRRDPWEAAEAKPGRKEAAYRANRRV